MCRFLAYQGTPELMSTLLYAPENSIIKQSYAAVEVDEPLNGDGFGVGWYAPEIDKKPGVFASVSPAWNNKNLQHISQKVKSGCMLAHVRAASVGAVAEANCHPFQFEQYLMMHNGGVEHFDLIKRSIVDKLSNTMYAWIQGQTDSEHIFALFLDKLIKIEGPPSTLDMAACLEETFVEVLQLMEQQHISEPAYFNVVVADGKKMVGSRYVSDKSVKPLTLHHSEHGKFVVEGGVTSLQRESTKEKGVIISSEKLTRNDDDWKMVPPHHFVLVEESQQVHFKGIAI